MSKHIWHLCMTGGSCGGKTTALDYVPQKLWEWGLRPLVIPEVATMLIHPGIRDICRIAEKNRPLYADIERAIFTIQHDIHTQYRTLAQSFAAHGERVVCIEDRGLMDVRAYTTHEEFMSFGASRDMTLSDIFHAYDLVIHLVTAADGAESFYTTKNNPARYEETIEDARNADRRTREAWTGYPQLHIIDNSTGFEEKIQRVIRLCARTFKNPVPIAEQKKFLIARCPDMHRSIFGSVRKAKIEQIYLRGSTPAKELRIRKQRLEDSVGYIETTKESLSGGKYHPTQRAISEDEYRRLSLFREPSLSIIRKTRYFFIHGNQYFRLDIFHEPAHFCILEIELTEDNQRIDLPHEFREAREVDASEYSNIMIASRLR